MLENEIVSRYYYLRGRIEHSLRTDKDMEKAITLITEPTQYKGVLTAKK